MTAVKYTVDDEEVKRVLKGVAGRMKNPAPALEQIGLLLIRSIARNFKLGGRPVKWKPSKRAQREGGKTLLDTARLARSITKQVTGKTLYVGTNVVYAAVHHFGARIQKNVTVREHWRIMRQAFGKPVPARRVLVKSHSRDMDIKIPARPFLLIQDADRRYMDRILVDHVTGGAA